MAIVFSYGTSIALLNGAIDQDYEEGLTVASNIKDMHWEAVLSICRGKSEPIHSMHDVLE
jgi:hypothetical protein